MILFASLLAGAAALTLVCACWLLYGLLRQNGRLLLRIEALETAFEQLSMQADAKGTNSSLAKSRINRSGLPAGTVAPAFRLPMLDGGYTTLDDYAGKPLLLVFSDPDCAPCMALLPKLDAAARQAGVTVLVISRGSVEANRIKLAQTGTMLPVALQAQWEISRLYGKFVTPMAYLIDERGRTAAEVATGGGAILALLARASADVAMESGPALAPTSRLTH